MAIVRVPLMFSFYISPSPYTPPHLLHHLLLLLLLLLGRRFALFFPQKFHAPLKYAK
jgi:hypothetical protein